MLDHDQRIISQEPIARMDVLEELKQLLTACDLDTREKYFFVDQNGLLTSQDTNFDIYVARNCFILLTEPF